jgi:putative ABC transport system permease protein
MITYYLKLGVRHLRRNPALTALIVLTIAVGIAASMTSLTVLHAMSNDPMPHKSDRLFVPQIDIRPVDNGDTDPDPPTQLTFRDAVALHEAGKAGKAKRNTAIYGMGPAIDSGRADLPPFFAQGLAVHADFFPMFDVPFVRGSAWSAMDEAKSARVVVIRESLAARVFGSADPIGKTLRVGEHDHVVTGVVSDAWEPLPKFYRLIGSETFGDFENLFLPFPTAINDKIGAQGQTSCYDEGSGVGFAGLLASECVWIQFWVELDSASDRAAYRQFLDGYVGEQKALGRLEHPLNNRLYNLTEWLVVQRVVANEAKLQTYIAFGFLLVCLVNTIGLLLARFTARAGEIGVRRALGASRRTVFVQYLVETAVLGLVCGLAGLGLTWLCLWLVGSRSEEIARLAQMDWQMLATALGLAVGATILAGLLPTWRAAGVRPAVQLKSQ